VGFFAHDTVGAGSAVTFTDDTGYFWFFNAANVELVVKVLDGRPINGMFWVFYGALSTVQYSITVTDVTTGASRQYSNPSGHLASGADTSAFTAAGEIPPPTPTPIPSVTPITTEIPTAVHTPTPFQTAPPFPSVTPIASAPTPGFIQLQGRRWYWLWGLCGQYEPPREPGPQPIQHTSPISIFVSQSGPNFSISIPDLGTITGTLLPEPPFGASQFSWTLTLNPPCTGAFAGIGGTDGSLIVFEITGPSGWSCPDPCSENPTGVVALYPNPR
jgi:hypothetical protein